MYLSKIIPGMKSTYAKVLIPTIEIENMRSPQSFYEGECIYLFDLKINIQHFHTRVLEIKFIINLLFFILNKFNCNFIIVICCNAMFKICQPPQRYLMKEKIQI